MKIKKYDEFTNEEAGYIRTILLSTLLSLGISKAQAQIIKNDQPKLSIVNTVANYNKNPTPRGLEDLRISLSQKVESPKKFIHDYELKYSIKF